VLRVLSSGPRRLGSEAVEIKNNWGCLSASHKCVHGVYRDTPSPLCDFTGVHCFVCETKHNASENESVPVVRLEGLEVSMLGVTQKEAF
jgi:hypothetical protein